MDAAGLPASEVDAHVWAHTEYVKKDSSQVTPRLRAIALEHFTAPIGDSLLRDPEQMGGSQEDHERMWRGRALKEVTHNAVAHDVYENRIGRRPGNGAERTLAMTLATALSWPVLVSFYWRMSQADENCREQGWRGPLKLVNVMMGKPGFTRRMIPE